MLRIERMTRHYVIWILLLFAGCTEPVEQKATHTQDLPHILQEGVLRVGILQKKAKGIKRRSDPLLDGRHWARKFAKQHGLKVRFHPQDTLSNAIQDLLNGRTDLVAEDLTITSLRQTIIGFTQPLKVIDEWLVGPVDMQKPPKTLADIRGREIHVRRTSSYWHTLNDLNASEDLGLNIVSVAEDEETETILHDISEGRIPLTLCDEHILENFMLQNKQRSRRAFLSTVTERGMQNMFDSLVTVCHRSDDGRIFSTSFC